MTYMSYMICFFRLNQKKYPLRAPKKPLRGDRLALSFYSSSCPSCSLRFKLNPHLYFTTKIVCCEVSIFWVAAMNFHMV